MLNQYNYPIENTYLLIQALKLPRTSKTRRYASYYYSRSFLRRRLPDDQAILKQEGRPGFRNKNVWKARSTETFKLSFALTLFISIFCTMKLLELLARSKPCGDGLALSET